MGNPIGSIHRSTPPARRHVIQPGWGFPRALIAHVAEQAAQAGVKPSRWARVALELADPATVAARLAEQDAALPSPSPDAPAPARRATPPRRA